MISSVQSGGYAAPVSGSGFQSQPLSGDMSGFGAGAGMAGTGDTMGMSSNGSIADELGQIVQLLSTLLQALLQSSGQGQAQGQSQPGTQSGGMGQDSSGLGGAQQGGQQQDPMMQLFEAMVHMASLAVGGDATNGNQQQSGPQSQAPGGWQQQPQSTGNTISNGSGNSINNGSDNQVSGNNNTVNNASGNTVQGDNNFISSGPESGSLADNKKTVCDSLDKAGATPQEKAMIIAMGEQETTNLDASQRDKSKDGTSAQNYSAFNLNPTALQLAGLKPGEDLNDQKNIGNVAVGILHGLREHGTENFLHCVRGGSTALQDGTSYGAQEYAARIMSDQQNLLNNPALLTNGVRSAGTLAHV